MENEENLSENGNSSLITSVKDPEIRCDEGRKQSIALDHQDTVDYSDDVDDSSGVETSLDVNCSNESLHSCEEAEVSNFINSENCEGKDSNDRQKEGNAIEELRNKLLRKTLPFAPQNSSHEDSSSLNEEPIFSISNPSRHIRIDNFQRPLLNKCLISWLEELCGHSDFDIWLNPIKTHCYLTFTSVDAARYCLEKVQGKKFDHLQRLPLVASFTTVSSKEAPTSSEAALPPKEYRQKAIFAQSVENISRGASTLSSKGFVLQVRNDDGKIEFFTKRKLSSYLESDGENKTRNLKPRLVDADLKETLALPVISWKPVNEITVNIRRSKLKKNGNV